MKVEKHRRNNVCRYLKCTPVSFKPKKKPRASLKRMLKSYSKFLKNPGSAQAIEEMRLWDQMPAVGMELPL